PMHPTLKPGRSSHFSGSTLATSSARSSHQVNRERSLHSTARERLCRLQAILGRDINLYIKRGLAVRQPEVDRPRLEGRNIPIRFDHTALLGAPQCQVHKLHAPPALIEITDDRCVVYYRFVKVLELADIPEVLTLYL